VVTSNVSLLFDTHVRQALLILWIPVYLTVLILDSWGFRYDADSKSCAVVMPPKRGGPAKNPSVVL
jgi:hypothetical protein